MEVEIKKVSVNKIGKRFIKKYGDVFDTYYWKVVVKDVDTKKTYKYIAAITLDNIRTLMLNGKSEDTGIENEAREKLQEYLIANQEVYLGEDGDLYLVGEC